MQYLIVLTAGLQETNGKALVTCLVASDMANALKADKVI